MNWYCVHTKPKKESLVQRYCVEVLGMESYLPKLCETKRIRRVRREVVTPLFPRYFFCRFNLANSYRAVKHAPDSLGLVSLGESPTVVRDEIVSELRAWAADRFDIVTIRPSLRAGDHVEIVAGPMRGLQAVILNGMRDSERVAVLLNALNFEARLIINRNELERAI